MIDHWPPPTTKAISVFEDVTYEDVTPERMARMVRKVMKTAEEQGIIITKIATDINVSMSPTKVFIIVWAGGYPK